jgi:hypothetical protein
MRESGSKHLSEQQELLLSSYVDDECSLLSRLRAERLIKRNESAKLFVQNLKNTSQTYRSLFSETPTSPDLWDKISQRIDAEERASLYLGQRKSETVAPHISGLANFFSKQALIGGLSGAAVAACVLMLVSRPAMEVDWMRSNGSLKIIQNPSDNSAIFWVRKRPVTPTLKVQGIKATPTIRVLREQGLDAMPLGTAK